MCRRFIEPTRAFADLIVSGEEEVTGLVRKLIDRMNLKASHTSRITRTEFLMETLISLLGIGILFGLGVLLSSGRHQINWRTWIRAFAAIRAGGIALYFPLGVAVLEAVSNAVSSVLNNAQDGIDFVFGSIGAFEMGSSLFMCCR